MTDSVTVPLALLLIAYGAFVFVAHGAASITALGILNYGSALFVGYAGFEVYRQGSPGVPLDYMPIALISSITTLALVNLALSFRGKERQRIRPMVAPSEAAGIVALGVGALVLLVLLDGIIPALIIEGAAFIAALSIGVSASLVRPGVVRWISAIFAVGGFVSYATLFHGGSGRLRMVALLVAIAIVLSMLVVSRALKFLAVVATPVLLIALAGYRLRFQESLSAGGSAGNTGLESLLATMEVFPTIIYSQEAGLLQPAGGSSLLTVPFVVLPQEFHPSWVPDALGYELVQLVRPDLWGTGYSTVASIYGEAWWNFGVVGVPVFAAVLLFLVMACERALRAATDLLERRPDGVAVLVMVIVVALCASSLDMVWNGVHGWLTRMLVRLPLWTLMLVIIWVLFRPRRVPRPIVLGASPSG